MTWRYEFIAAQRNNSEPLVIDGGKFKATDQDDARSVLASVLRNIRVSGPTKPDAIRLIDPQGREVWRALLGHASKRDGTTSRPA